MARRALFVAIASGVAVGCSLFVDLDGLSGGSSGGSDVFVPDGSTADAPSAVDASDAGPEIDAARFTCPDASIVCDDFDDAALGALWSRVDNQNGTLVIDDDASVSPPDSLHVVLPDNPGGSLTRTNRVEKDVVDLGSLRCDFDVRLVATDSTTDYDAQLFTVYLNVPGFADWELQINLQAAGLYFEQDSDTGQDGGSLTSSDQVSALVAGTWRHVRITTDFQTAQLSVDGVAVYDKALPTPLPMSTASGTVMFGQVDDAEPAAWDYRIDDVVCVAP